MTETLAKWLEKQNHIKWGLPKDFHKQSWIFGGFIPSSNPYSKSTTEPKIIRCSGCGGEVKLTGDFIDLLPKEEGTLIKLPCKYGCKNRVKEIKKRLNDA